MGGGGELETRLWTLQLTRKKQNSKIDWLNYHINTILVFDHSILTWNHLVQFRMTYTEFTINGDHTHRMEKGINTCSVNFHQV